MPHMLQPKSIEEATQFLARHGDDARVLYGSAVPSEIESATSEAGTLIDPSLIPGMDYIREDGDYIRLGARVTHAQVIASELLDTRAHPLVRACSMFEELDVREVGTIAGDIASAIPTNLTIAPLWAMGAEVKLKSARGERVVTFNDFFQARRKTAQTPTEMIVEIAFSKMSPKDKGTFLATGWSPDETQTHVTVAIVLEFEEDEISNAWITLGGIAPTVVNAIDAEQALVGQWLSDAAIDEAAELATNAADETWKASANLPGLTETVRDLVTRALKEIRDTPGS